MVVLTIVMAALSAGYIYLVVRTVRRSRRIGGGYIVQYLPVKGMPLSDAAIFTRRDANVAAATLIDLTVRKKIRILAPPTPRDPVAVEFVNGVGLHPDEVAIMEALFGQPGYGRRIRFFTRDNRPLARALRGILGAAQDRLTRIGLVQPGTSRLRPVLFAAGWAGMIVGFLVMFNALTSGALIAAAVLFFAILGFTVPLCVIPRAWRVFTEAAAPYRDHLNGLYDYITLAEADRFRVLQSPQGALQVPVESVASGMPHSGHPVAAYLLNERLLPYAVLFGHGKEWLDKLRVDAETIRHTDHLDLGGVDLGSVLDATLVVTHLALLFDILDLDSFGDLAGVVGNVVDVAEGASLADFFDGLDFDL